MPFSSTALLSSLLFLIVAAGTEAYNSRQTECTFPVRWESTWFQSGVRQPILISRSVLSSKGRCLHNEGDKFLLVDEKSCYRCVVIHEKHSNVLQYKETYCHGRNSLSSLCSYITGDALLYSMFREEAPAVPCPFRGPMTFSYNRGHGTCSSPQSNVDTCTDDSRLLFRYQACPDVPASESAVEELECLATWKEGSSRYLVGRLHHRHASSNEDRYRCFVYERAGQTIGGLNRAGLGTGTVEHDVALPGGPIPEGTPEIYRVAQSGDATCNGLFSPMEGSRTMTLRKAPSPGKCRFPSWLTGYTSGGLAWHTLDLTRSYTFHPKNASLHVTRSNGSVPRSEGGPLDGQDVPGQDEQDVKILCNSIKQSNPTQTMSMLVAHFTVGCRSGFMCMTFYRRDGHVVEVQTGNAVSRPEEACSSPHYLPHSIPYLTLVTSSPEPRQCPYLGKFTVTGMNRNQRNTRESKQNHEVRRDKEKVRHAQDKTEERHGRKIDLDVETRRANNEYLIHEHKGRKTRSDRTSRDHRDSSSEIRELKIPRSRHDLEYRSSKRSLNVEDFDRAREVARSKTRRTRRIEDTDDGDDTRTRAESSIDFNGVDGDRQEESRFPTGPKMEDFVVDVDDFTRLKDFSVPRYDETPDVSHVQMDYFGDYNVDGELPKKRSVRRDVFVSYRDLVRSKRDLDDNEGEEREYSDKREKREEEESRCTSDVTTLTVGCSTADRMEFQSDCVDDDAVTAYSCHGRWFDAEGTQFVIATPLARRTTWSNGNSRPQPFRNSRRLCFMYRENGGVVSLTASPTACQRGIPPPPPMLAFNATSIGQCTEENDGARRRASYLLIILLAITAVIFR